MTSIKKTCKKYPADSLAAIAETGVFRPMNGERNQSFTILY